MELEQSTPMGQIKGLVWGSVCAPEFNMKHLKNAEGLISQNIEYNNKDEVSSLNVLSNSRNYASRLSVQNLQTKLMKKRLEGN